ncbi:hypothetical protein [Geodermatophilus sp. SYSU D00700]
MTATPKHPDQVAAEARSAVLKAARDALPQASSKPLEGKTDVGDGTGHLAQWTARVALMVAAEQVAAEIGQLSQRQAEASDASGVQTAAPSPQPDTSPTDPAQVSQASPAPASGSSSPQRDLAPTAAPSPQPDTSPTDAAQVSQASPAPASGSSSPQRRPRLLLVEHRDLVAKDWPYAHVLWNLQHHAQSLRQRSDLVTEAISDLDGLEPTPPGTDEDLNSLASRDDLLLFTSRRRGLGTIPITEQISAYTASAADVLGLLRTDYALSSSALDVSSSTLTAAVASALIAQPVDVVVDGFHLVQEEGPVHTALNATLAVDAALAVAQANLQRRLFDYSEDDRPQVTRARELDKEATAIRAAWAATLTSLTTAPAEGLPPLAAAAVQAAIRDVPTGVTHVVHLSLDSSGTDVISRRSLFGPSGRLRLVGGVTVSWLLVTTAAGTGTGALIGAGSRYQGWATDYDLGTGAFAGAPIAAFAPLQRKAQAQLAESPPADVVPTKPALKMRWKSSETASGLIVAGLAVAGAAWLLLDGLSKVL